MTYGSFKVQQVNYSNIQQVKYAWIILSWMATGQDELISSLERRLSQLPLEGLYYCTCYNNVLL